jgi:predicted house-cleaning noncanonical NTP pyrophosphatase (MazG superfamily)
MESFNKLVRDRIPEILDGKGVPYEKRIASPEEYEKELIKKLLEEAGEFSQSGGDPEELADVIEVIEALKKLPNYTNVEELRLKKQTERGAFDEGVILKGQKD